MDRDERVFTNAQSRNLASKNLSLPNTAYILLWYPLPSETFIFREVQNAADAGMPLQVYTLYGQAGKHCSPDMRRVADAVTRLGSPAIPGFFRDLAWWAVRRPLAVAGILAGIPWRRWSCLEVAGENVWAMMAGFTLARRFLADDIEHIHAGWANGPATAAWVASRLTDIPFSFSARPGTSILRTALWWKNFRPPPPSIPTTRPTLPICVPWPPRPRARSARSTTA
jgi:hypothetical protein